MERIEISKKVSHHFAMVINDELLIKICELARVLRSLINNSLLIAIMAKQYEIFLLLQFALFYKRLVQVLWDTLNIQGTLYIHIYTFFNNLLHTEF